MNVVEQIAFNYSIEAALSSTDADASECTLKILRLKAKKISYEQEKLLESIGFNRTGADYNIGYDIR